ncbi:MAG: ABC transporter substrate-binding protein [Deltaproteobacteria bacterium]|nr:ABC transporter substrate-binding protein [Deltaproteobacteria bacterium]
MKTSCAKKFWVILVALSLIGAIGCEREKDRVSSKRIKVGALFPLSGDLKDKGADSANGVRLAAEEINRAGGIAALDGAKLEIVFADTEGKPEMGVKEAERLIEEEGVVAVIGTYQSSVTKPATQVAERLETPFIVSISIADIITERGFDYTFRIQPKAGFYARDQVRFIKDLKKVAGYPVKRVALLHENTDFGTSTALAQKSALREHGLEVVADIAYRAEGVTDLNREVNRVLAARPDVILTVTYLMDSILIRRALKESGAPVPMVDTAGGTVSPEYIQTLGPLAEGTLTMAEYSKFAPGGKALNDRFRKRFKTDITGDSAHAYQAVLVLKDALERSGSLDKDKLREALSATDIGKGPQLVLPSERLRFDKDGQNEFARLYVVQIQEGELVPVWPTQYATAKVKIKE